MNTMIYLRLAGGLGNQLFQLAAALTFSKSSSDPILLVVNGLARYPSARNSEALRLFTEEFLERFEMIPAQHASAIMIDRLRLGRWLPRWGVNDKTRHCFRNAQLQMPTGPLFMDGYFQSGWHLNDLITAASLMRKSLIEPSDANEEASRTLIFHVRGGDFLKVPLHQVVDLAYYVQAVHEIQREGYSFDKCQCITDDPSYAKDLMSELSKIVDVPKINICMPAEDPLEDFLNIGAHSLRILPNSTFSWWASLLGSHDGLVISPKQFTKERDRDISLPYEILLDGRKGWSRVRK